jgi:hypothetical protein
VVSFESVNALGQGRYFNGQAPSCAALDEPVRGFGMPQESLIAVALEHMDTGQCPQRLESLRGKSKRPLGLLPPLD